MSWLSQALRKAGKWATNHYDDMGAVVGGLGGALIGQPMAGAALGRVVGSHIGPEHRGEKFKLGHIAKQAGTGAAQQFVGSKAGSFLKGALGKAGVDIPSGDVGSYLSTKGSTLKPNVPLGDQVLSKAQTRATGFVPNLLGNATVPNAAAIPHRSLGNANVSFSGGTNLWDMVGLGDADTSTKALALGGAANAYGSYQQGKAEEAQLEAQGKQRQFENDLMRQRMLWEERDRKKQEEEEEHYSQMLGPILMKLLERAQANQMGGGR